MLMLWRLKSVMSFIMSSIETVRPLSGFVSWRFTPLNLTGWPLTRKRLPTILCSLKPTFFARMSSPFRMTSV